ncbi:hypothetical protein CYR55_06805 [Chimaeribacter californicus]|uniref:DUF3131 domain-containing protein n=1 Tax=Chimaeribacter californicus TaxID=2060067 RepID=A0A2N5EBX0_9GAMM|nr:DUF3131 domain-containing protein [Chimaeribacter californicus]PLR39584.1 hypothetical protein CYR55_06805 [Chimaeribacter californicus]
MRPSFVIVSVFARRWLAWLPLLLGLWLAVGSVQAEVELPAQHYPVRHGELTPREQAIAVNAWQYFVANYQPTTGLVNAVNKYPSTTMWDTGSYIAAMVAARELGIIDKAEFDRRMIKLLKTLNTLVLFQNEMPNKVYNTITAQKVNYLNKPGEIGFSAIDIGRMLLWLKIVKERYPEYGNSVDNIVLGWDFTHTVDDCGTLYGAYLDGNKKTVYAQEGRLGYEEYASAGFQLWGFSTCQAARPEPYALANIYCVLVPYDTRDPRLTSQHNYVVTESYLLHGLEMGWDKSDDREDNLNNYSHPWMKNFADRVYQAQENRYMITGTLTARSEHQLDKAPYFVYDTVFADGFNWNTITDKGKYVPETAAISLKAALGMWVLWDSPYTDRLLNTIENANEKGSGYYEGIYENGDGPIKEFTGNNNGIMLESLLYKKEGRLLKFNTDKPKSRDFAPSLWEKRLVDAFEDNNTRRNRPFMSVTPGIKNWCEQTGVAVRSAPACKACKCAACQNEDAPIKLPPVAMSCLKP